MSGPPTNNSATKFAEAEGYQYPMSASQHPMPASQQPMPASQQQSSQTNVVVNQPNPLPQVTVVQTRRPSTTPWTLIFAVVLTLILGVQLFIPIFFCLVPGVVLAVVGYARSDRKEDRHTVKAINGVSLCCSVSALFIYTLAFFYGVFTLLFIYSIWYVRKINNYYY